ncbi:MAG TPA: hypothetical protein DDW17_06350 [Deltaproteobacteria bacterium]|nr:hypothetical protein [Deltaproteobacteria bacterium]
MFIEVGPASIVITGEKGGLPYEFHRARVEKVLKQILEEIKDILPVLKQKAYRIKNTVSLPHVARKMVEAVKMVDEETLTPMAAVAGAVSDEIKTFLEKEDCDYLSINNGGDISILSKEGKDIYIGIGQNKKRESIPYRVTIRGLKEFGVATSGFGGRSFTLGIADAVTVFAKTASIADAAATYLCNKTAIESDSVIRRKASEIDPLTDIPDELVTYKRKRLKKSDILQALEKGLVCAKGLKELHCIYNAILLLNGQIVSTIGEGEKNIVMEVQNGSKKDSYCH